MTSPRSTRDMTAGTTGRILVHDMSARTRQGRVDLESDLATSMEIFRVDLRMLCRCCKFKNQSCIPTRYDITRSPWVSRTRFYQAHWSSGAPDRGRVFRRPVPVPKLNAGMGQSQTHSTEGVRMKVYGLTAATAMELSPSSPS